MATNSRGAEKGAGEGGRGRGMTARPGERGVEGDSHAQKWPGTPLTRARHLDLSHRVPPMSFYPGSLCVLIHTFSFLEHEMLRLDNPTAGPVAKCHLGNEGHS